MFLVPSLALAEQTLTAWLNDSDIPIRPFVVASDKTIGKDEDSIDKTTILTIPPLTDPIELTQEVSKEAKDKMTVIISTYQSIDAIEEAQKQGLPDFDIVICDEAHYTAGVSKKEGELTSFKKVHDNDIIRAKKRLYMTATPKVFSENAKTKAQEYDLEIYDMSDVNTYGETFYRYSFADAVRDGHLADYKIVVFAVKEKEIQEKLYDYLQRGYELNDTAKMVGMLKVFEGNIEGEIKKVSIKRAVAFCSSIKKSKEVAKNLPEVINAYGTDVKVSVEHIDGSMRADERKKLLNWLKDELKDVDVKLLTNAKVLTEGIDVPALDSVIFLHPRKSVIDIVQAMGRVMRKTKDKEYGYIVIPVIVPEGKSIEEVIETQEYRTIFQVANALASIDDTFQAKVRQIIIKDGSLYKEKHEAAGIEGEVSYSNAKSESSVDEDDSVIIVSDSDMNIASELKKYLIPKTLDRIGGRKYLKTWVDSVADKVRIFMNHINIALTKEEKVKRDFKAFVNSLKDIINPSITEEEAKSMLVQHILTKPIFEAIFEGYSFLKDNPVAQTMDKVVSQFQDFIQAQTKDLEGFYKDVKNRSLGLDKENERADFLRQLYNSFFKVAFPDIVKRLGIVYTPVELVDFIIRSVDDIVNYHPLIEVAASWSILPTE